MRTLAQEVGESVKGPFLVWGDPGAISKGEVPSVEKVCAFGSGELGYGVDAKGVQGLEELVHGSVCRNS